MGRRDKQKRDEVSQNTCLYELPIKYGEKTSWKGVSPALRE